MMDIDTPIQHESKPTFSSVVQNPTHTLNASNSPSSNLKSKPSFSSVVQNSPSTQENTNSKSSNPTPKPAPQPKPAPTYDWFSNFPITADMQPHTKLQTSFPQQLYDLLKSHLHNFYSGSILKTATLDKQPLKASFYHIICTMAGERPEFLTNYIYQINPSINKQATIPFNILEDTFKKIVSKFTTILFTKLNYIEIFASSATIPPYKPENRLQFCLNLARLHLYLHNSYQHIDYNKFAEDLNFRPKTFKLSSHTISTDQEEKYLTIKHDNKFNIQQLFNIPSRLFQKQFSIPSLKNSLDHFNE